MTSKNLLRAGALALAFLIARAEGASARDLIFGFGHVDLRPVQEAQAWRCNWASHPRHRHVRTAMRCAYVSRLAQGSVAGSSRLLSVARGYLGHRRFAGMPGKWCAAGLRLFLRQSGHSVAGTDNRAISFAHYGRPTSPHPGAVGVERHHVGLIAAVRGDSVILLSANHAGRVVYGVYPLRRFIAFRDPV